MNRFLKGAMILTLAGIIVKVIGHIYYDCGKAS